MSVEAAIRAGVAGKPIAHSLSPVIHSAWIAALGLDAAYGRFEPEDGADFARLAERVRAGELAGINVTAPYKGDALAAADDVRPRAAACGSVNLLYRRGDRLIGDSTDGEGLMGALAEQAPGLDVAGRTVVMLGAGGAARAAVQALNEAGARVRIVNRTRDKAQALAAELGGAAADWAEAAPEAVLVVNALSAPPQVDLALLPDGAVLMDMTYKPLETAFLAAGRARGLIGVDGLAMLIGQARPSFQAIFGQTPPVDVDVRTVCLKTLEAQA